MNEIQRKIKFIQDYLTVKNIAALRLRGVDWFSWITGGGSSIVILTAETGIAEVFVTQKEAWILANHIEYARLKTEEVPAEFSITDFPWQDSKASDSFVKEKIGNGVVVSDRPFSSEQDLPMSLKIYKMRMQPEEILRYREVGKKAAESMTEAMSLAKPNWTENQLAGAGAQALWSRGLDPTQILVGGEQRGKRYRQPLSKNSKLGAKAMMVFSVRGYGLYANLTRFVFFRDLESAEKKSFESLNTIESAGLKKITPGNSIADVYAALETTYEQLGLAPEVNQNNQGGPTGYLSRELIAKTGKAGSMESEFKMEAGMAFAWNPSLPGAKVEDTVLLHDQQLEILTNDPKWPTQVINGVKRPIPWIRK